MLSISRSELFGYWENKQYENHLFSGLPKVCLYISQGKKNLGICLKNILSLFPYNDAKSKNDWERLFLK